MKSHVDFGQYFDPKIADPQPADPETSQVADDIEYKWERKRAEEAAKALVARSIEGSSAVDGGHHVDPA
jgi:hypothetical protein